MVTALSMEQDIPDYDMDEEDENWVKKQAQAFDLTPFKFEIMMDRLEKGSGQKVWKLLNIIEFQCVMFALFLKSKYCAWFMVKSGLKINVNEGIVKMSELAVGLWCSIGYLPMDITTISKGPIAMAIGVLSLISLT